MSARAAAGSPTQADTGAPESAGLSPAGAEGSLAATAEGAGDGLSAQRDAPVGGQAVLEGVMMRGVSNWAVAVRKPTVEQLQEGERSPEEPALGEIAVSSFPLTSVLKRRRLLRVPIVRGVVALGESLVIGFRALEVSANAQLPPEEEQEIPRGVWAGTVVVALALAIVLFFLIPVGLTSLIKGQLGSSFLFWLIEGVVRTSIFLGYLLLLSRLRDLRRVFEYHGAEHKTISCFEAGLPLTPTNAQRFSRLHPRFRTPHITTIWTGVFVGGIAAVVDIGSLADLTNIGTLFAFILVCIGVVILRRTDANRGSHREGIELRPPVVERDSAAANTLPHEHDDAVRDQKSGRRTGVSK